MSRFFLILLLALLAKSLWGQYFNFGWAKKAGGSSNDESYAITADKTGNIIITGLFTGTADMDPGPGVVNLVAKGYHDAFVAKYQPNGSLIWARAFNGPEWEEGLSVKTDAQGNIFIAGAFMNTTDFDPGASVYNLTAIGFYNLFITKLDPSGNLVWAGQLGGDGQGKPSLAVDPNGNVFISDGFEGTFDFDPGPGNFNLSSTGGTDIYVVKLTNNGGFLWARTLGGNSYSNTYDIAADTAGNVYLTGDFSDSVDFDPGPGTRFMKASGDYDIFVCKLDKDGGLVWVQALGGTDVEQGLGITLDTAANIYLTGCFKGNADMDPGQGIFYLNSAGDFDVFILKLNAEGGLVWAKRYGGPDADVGIDLVTDLYGNVFTTGYWGSNVGIDPDACLNSTISPGELEIFISCLNQQGNQVWVKQLGGPGYDAGYGVTIGNNGNLFCTGYFSQTADMDPGSGNYLLSSSGKTDIFLQSMERCDNPTFNDTTIYSCGPFSFGCLTFQNSGTYKVFLSNSTGCDSILTMNLTILNSASNNIRATACSSYTWRGKTYIASGIYHDTLSAAGGCDSIITLSLTILNSARSSITATACGSYSWKGKTYTASGLYYDTLTAAGGCDSIITLNLTILNTARSSISATACRSYSWRGKTFTASGLYYDTLTAAGGCDSIITLNLTILNPTRSSITATACRSFIWRGKTFTATGLYHDTLSAAGGCDSILDLQLTILPPASSVISLDICQGQQFAGHMVSGTFLDTLVAANGCDSFRTIQLTVVPPPNPNLGPDRNICLGDTVILTPGTFNTYSWQNGSNSSSFTVLQAGLYTVTVTNNCGTAQDEIRISQEACQVWFPSAFSPDNNGLNDLFRMAGNARLSEFRLIVYNRWGEKVFETTNPSQGWNGNFKGIKQPGGVFNWLCRYRETTATTITTIKGTVMLIR